MLERISKRWHGSGGCAEVLRIAFPLILSTSAHTVQMFTDRMFLYWHSTDQMSAAMPAGITAFTFLSFFMGTVTYVNAFVAQYRGAGRPQRIGPAIWQGIYFSIFTGMLMFLLIPAATPIFDATGHDPAVRQHEVTYFRILCMGGIPVLISSTISCFYSGRGKTWPIFYINTLGTLINVVLDYAMIFGKLGFPEWGIAGAAWATNIASISTAAIYLGLFLRKYNRQQYHTLQGAKTDWDLFKRLMRFGLPTGVQFTLDILAFTLFIALVGRIDKLSLTASTMTFQINMLAFMPMIGFGIAVETLVGQSLGRNDPGLANRYTWSAFYMTFGYMSLIALGYWLIPDLFLYPFQIKSEAVEFAATYPIAVKLLCFVAFYCLFDTGNIIFASALKGAGDTKFTMMVPVVLSWTVLVIPVYLAIRFGWGLYVAWSFATVYVCLLSIVFFVRFLRGKWKSMRVIEAAPPPLAQVPEVPTVEVEI